METGTVGTRAPVESLDPNTLRDRDLLVQALLALDSPGVYNVTLKPLDNPIQPTKVQERSPLQAAVPTETSQPAEPEFTDNELLIHALLSLESPPVIGATEEHVPEPILEKKNRFINRRVVAVMGASALALLMMVNTTSEKATDTYSSTGQDIVTSENINGLEAGAKSDISGTESKQRVKNKNTDAAPKQETESKQQESTKEKKEEAPKEKSRPAKAKPDRKDKTKSHEIPAKAYVRPVGYEYEITCPLNGYENISGFHTGVDYGTPENTIVKAPRGGVVVAKGTSGGAGRYLTIRHPDGRLSIFQHLNSYFVNVGEGVEQGADIARTGSTGTKEPHLHWTLTKPEAVSDGDIPSKDDAGVEDRVENPQNFYE